MCEYVIRNLLNHRAKDFWGDTVKALTVGYNANTAHLYSRGREKYTLFLWRKETHWTRFFSKEYDCVKLAYIQ